MEIDPLQAVESRFRMLTDEKHEALRQLAAANARIAELERCVVCGGDGKPIGSLPWETGNSRTGFYDGERIFVALRVGTGEGEDRREWWEFFVVQAVCDEVTPLHFTSEPEDWGWEWEDVEWYVEIGDLISTLPSPDQVPEGGK